MYTYGYNDAIEREDTIMWNTKQFKTEQQARKWIWAHRFVYRSDLVFMNNGFVVEYKPLVKVY